MRRAPRWVALLVLFVGCVPVPKGPHDMDVAAKGFKPPVGQARIYVYAGERSVAISVDGRLVGGLDAGRYVFADVEAGSHDVAAMWRVKNRGARLQLDATRDTAYFVRLTDSWNPFHWPRLLLVSDAEGRQAVSARHLAVIP